MSIFDRLTGTRRPATGVTPRPAADVRAALLDLNRPDRPWAVRDGAAEGADLVAEWRMTESAWRTFFARNRLSREVQVRMRLVTADYEVRALDQQWEVTWAGDTPRRAVPRQYGRGPAKTVSRHWTIGRGPDGRLQTMESFHFDSSHLKDPLRDTVLAAGWTWRGVVFGRL